MRAAHGPRGEEIHFRSLTERIGRSAAHGRFALQMNGAMAECFLELSREHTIEGLRAALVRGRRGGQPKASSESESRGGPCPARCR